MSCKSCCYKQAESQYECPAILGIGVAVLVGFLSYFIMKYMKVGLSSTNMILVSVAIAVIGGFVLGYFSFKDGWLKNIFGGWCVPNSSSGSGGQQAGATCAPGVASCAAGLTCDATTNTCVASTSTGLMATGNGCSSNSDCNPPAFCADGKCCLYVPGYGLKCD